MYFFTSYLDGDGLVKYFPIMSAGSDSLTAYLLAIPTTSAVGFDVRPMVIHGPAGIDHQFINTGDEDLKAVFIFTPPGEEQAILDEMDHGAPQ